MRPEFLPFVYAFCILTLLTNVALSYGKKDMSIMIMMMMTINNIDNNGNDNDLP